MLTDGQVPVSMATRLNTWSPKRFATSLCAHAPYTSLTEYSEKASAVKCHYTSKLPLLGRQSNFILESQQIPPSPSTSQSEGGVWDSVQPGAMGLGAAEEVRVSDNGRLSWSGAASLGQGVLTRGGA